MRTKGQMEVMGLVIIVILFSLGLLFAVRFVVLKPKSDVRESFATTQMASNMLNALMKTTSNCRGADFKELFTDCATVQQIDCDYDDNAHTNAYPDGSPMADSCHELDTSIRKIFSETFEIWKRRYLFIAYFGEDPWTDHLEFTPISSVDCGYMDIGDLEEHQLSTQEGVLKIMLKLCD